MDSIISSEIYVEDCIRYNSNTYTSNTNFNYPLPSTFKIECDFLITTITNNSCILRVGESDSKALLNGKVGSGDNVYKIYARKSSTGTGDIITTGNSITTSNDWQTQTITFDGTTYSYQGMSITNFNTVSLTYLHSFATWKSGTNSGQIKNIKIKPL